MGTRQETYERRFGTSQRSVEHLPDTELTVGDLEAAGITAVHSPLRIALFVLGMLGCLAGLIYLAADTHRSRGPVARPPRPPVASAVAPLPPPDPERVERLRRHLLGLDREGAGAAQAEAVTIDAVEMAARVHAAEGAFQPCVAQEVARNGAFPGRWVTLGLIVKPDGSVAEARIEDGELAGSPLAVCLADKARGLTLPSFEGLDLLVRLDVPLYLDVGI